MVRLAVIQIAEPDALALEALRQYAAVSDAGQDNVLILALKRAFYMVQRAADVALLPGTSAYVHRTIREQSMSIWVAR